MRAAILILVLCAGACASAARNTGLDPVGTFDFTTSVEGASVNGSIVVARTSQGLSGTIHTDVTEPIAIGTVAVEGQTMRISATTPDGPLELTLTFTGNDFTGGWSIATAGMSGQLTGKRRTTG